VALEIRRARVDEAAMLSRLAMAAKAHWGYDARTLEGWRTLLEVSAAHIAATHAHVGEADGEVVGFYTLAAAARDWELDNLWVVPQSMDRGFGRALLEHALRIAREGGADAVTVDADPHAEPFYLACGAVRVGEIAAPIEGDPRRVRPQLRYALS
jgi:GNAT superfamily N-acetyltransferase